MEVVSPDGFETFWACNCSQKKGAQGFNGVATFARKGLTVAADAKCLQDPALDAEGRCLKTDHGAFVLFNVYVPAGSGAARGSRRSSRRGSWSAA